MKLQERNCIICTKVFNSNSMTSVEDVLHLVKLLVETINTNALQNALICTACLEKLNNAVNFKMSRLVKQENINAEARPHEIDCVICYICKNFTKIDSAKLLSDSCYEDVVSYVIPEEDSDHLDNLRICDDCHTSLLNFQNIKLSLSVYDLNEVELNSGTEADINEEEFKIDIVDNCLPEELDLKVDFEAGVCNAEFWNITTEDQGTSTTLPCPENLGTDTNDSDLKISISKIEMDYNESSNNLKSKKSDKNLGEPKMFKCSDCEFQAKCTQDLYRHANIHNSVNKVGTLQCQNSEFQTQHNRYLYVLIHRNTNEDKMFKCHICEFQTKQKIYLKKHLLIHKNIKEIEMFKCPNCEFQTKYQISLNKHLLIHKNINEVEVFECDVCEYQTKVKSCLGRHGLIHKNITEIKMFKCPNCEFQTKYQISFKRHLLIHRNITEVKVFKCDICEHQTKFKDNLRKHELVHKNINEVKMFKCQNCQYQTKHEDYLRRHALVHRNINKVKMFKCPNCEFQTKHKRSLNKHLLIHKNINEVEVFECDVCEYQTKVKSRLGRHGLIHKNITEIKMFKCQNCEYQSKRKGNLKDHLLVHKKTNECL